MVPVFARTAPCAGPSSSRFWSVPETPATGSGTGYGPGGMGQPPGAPSNPPYHYAR